MLLHRNGPPLNSTSTRRRGTKYIQSSQRRDWNSVMEFGWFYDLCNGWGEISGEVFFKGGNGGERERGVKWGGGAGMPGEGGSRRKYGRSVWGEKGQRTKAMYLRNHQLWNTSSQLISETKDRKTTGPTVNMQLMKSKKEIWPRNFPPPSPQSLFVNSFPHCMEDGVNLQEAGTLSDGACPIMLQKDNNITTPFFIPLHGGMRHPHHSHLARKDIADYEHVSL